VSVSVNVSVCERDKDGDGRRPSRCSLGDISKSMIHSADVLMLCDERGMLGEK